MNGVHRHRFDEIRTAIGHGNDRVAEAELGEQDRVPIEIGRELVSNLNALSRGCCWLRWCRRR